MEAEMTKCGDLIKKNGIDILNSKHHKQTRQDIQHGNMSVRQHEINVARYSLLISEKLGITCNRRALVRGALLHDFFRYDWHDREHSNLLRLHGLYHPGIALKNAEQEFELSDVEKEIIRKHMWPLTVVPPLCREAWIVSAADKYCSLMETIRLHRKNDIKNSRKHQAR